MKILIAPDSFKGSLSAAQFCDIAEKAILSRLPSAKIMRLPLADGGEGTVESLLSLPGAQKIEREVTGPMGARVMAHYGYIPSEQTAIIEMASASGLPLVLPEQRNALQASTRGTGELFKDALERGAKKILLGLGGSATTDAGVGMLAELGFQFLDSQGRSIELNGAGLERLVSIQLPDDNYHHLDIQVACDIRNPLYGPEGAAHVFGPQKGASEAEVLQLDRGLRNFAQVLAKEFALEIAQLEGAGAAGGMGGGLQLIGGHLCSGFEMVADFVGLKALLRNEQFDLVITGEGQLNHQSLNGKVPVEVARCAKREGAHVLAVVGAIDEPNEVVFAQGFDAVFALANKPLSVDECMTLAPQLLYEKMQNVAGLLSVGLTVSH